MSQIKLKTKHKTRGRKDHYLPQGYLRGFIDPSREDLPKPLWYFDAERRKWSERSTSEVGYGVGFYDYIGNVAGVETADQAFAELERNYPKVRDELISTNFANWLDHRDFLLHFMQMIRLRSPLFFDQSLEQGRTVQALEIVEVSADRRGVKVVPKQLPDNFVRNRALTNMREELRKGADWLSAFDWALRYCESPNDPCITTDNPCIVEGICRTVADALQHPETLLFFPLCWQACLIGSRRHFDIKLDRFVPEDLKMLRQKYRQNAKQYIVSPSKLNDF